MGPMRFIDRSHREGPLGSVENRDGDTLAGGVAGYLATGDLLDQHPLLPHVLGVSAPEATHYQLGDCTVHHGHCVHGSVSNTTQRDQLGYLWSYTCADARYLRGENEKNGSDRMRAEDELGCPTIFRPLPLGPAASAAKL